MGASSDDDRAFAAAPSSPSVSPDTASIPSAREPWRAFTEMPAWSDGRRNQVFAIVIQGMEIWREDVAGAQERYERSCANLADFMAAFQHLSAIVAAEAAEAFVTQPATGAVPQECAQEPTP